MKLKDIKQANFENKRVLMRVDFNVEVEDGRPKERYKIESAKRSIDFVLSASGVKLALLSHLGRPKDREEELSFKDFSKGIEKILGKEVLFVSDCVGEEVANALRTMKENQILVLENVRFYKDEIEGSLSFAKKLAENFDIFVNEAFGVSYNDHSSLTRITEVLTSFAGFNLQEEVESLSKIRENFQRPAVAVIGGAKVETKVPVINFFAEKYDVVLVGGKIGLEVKKQEIDFPQNVILPSDYIGAGSDIGSVTIENFSPYLKDARVIVWNGPLGKFEDEKFRAGTQNIAKAIVENENAYKLAGGGETVQFLEESGLIGKFNFISTGGGAMLEFLVKGTLPGLEVLKV